LSDEKEQNGTGHEIPARLEPNVSTLMDSVELGGISCDGKRSLLVKSVRLGANAARLLMTFIT
jgi:hypothetical protein